MRAICRRTTEPTTCARTSCNVAPDLLTPTVHNLARPYPHPPIPKRRHFGGGYQDVKPASRSWDAAFACLEADPSIWMLGSHETGPGHKGHTQCQAATVGTPSTPLNTPCIAHTEHGVWATGRGDIGCDGAYARAAGTTCAATVDAWRQLAANGAYIMRPDTPLVIEWFDARGAHTGPRLLYTAHCALSKQRTPSAVWTQVRCGARSPREQARRGA